MKKLGIKLLVLVMFVLSAFGTFAGCGKPPKELVIWTFTDEIHKIVGNYYLKEKTGKEFGTKINVYKAADTGLDYDIKVVITPSENFQTKLDPVLKSGKNAPDIFALEAQYMLKYISSGAMASFDKEGLDLQARAESDLTPYVNEIAKDKEGKLRAISMQATPGAFFYRRSIAKDMGLTSEEMVQAKISDFDKFMTFAGELKEKNDYRILSALGDIAMPLYSAREKGWIDGENLNIDKLMFNPVDDGQKDYLDYARLLQVGNNKGTENDMYINESTPWSNGWFADMSGDKVFGYFLPSWGLSYLLKKNAVATAGDWGVVKGPQTFYNGGTWLTARQGSKMIDEAKDFIEYYGLNEEFAEQWARDTGDFLSNKKVVEKIKGEMNDEFLGGQNHYELFAELVDDIDPSTMSPYDMSLNSYFETSVISYATQTDAEPKTKKECVQLFVDAFRSSYPALKVPQSIVDSIT